MVFLVNALALGVCDVFPRRLTSVTGSADGAYIAGVVFAVVNERTVMIVVDGVDLDCIAALGTGNDSPMIAEHLKLHLVCDGRALHDRASLR